jgi:hypothetical protein
MPCYFPASLVRTHPRWGEADNETRPQATAELAIPGGTVRFACSGANQFGVAAGRSAQMAEFRQ